jgi:hypothetical protein
MTTTDPAQVYQLEADEKATPVMVYTPAIWPGVR